MDQPRQAYAQLTPQQRKLIHDMQRWIASRAAKPDDPVRPISKFLEDVTYARNVMREAGIPEDHISVIAPQH